ncbi:hypothetical protein QQX10_00820 [Demequina sp. SYSU T00039]|uniref:Uncharacterized protein n=1 Tax=Demequina lignilytica TaxID=3051663 RepID=A0AAW7M0K7_9MICO|nr:hypothetical protein [Demequina sp. SYSU T00039]MDN4486704.1 hypothetical protein [Demequina sp. SYSU T00039]
MLNSRYAPVVALTALAVIVIGLLGWFLAISPQLSKAGDLASTADQVRANTEQVSLASAKIDQYAALLAEESDVPDQIAANAPSRLDRDAFRTRLWDGIDDSGLNIISYEMDTSRLVEGWVIEASALTSNQVASLFQTGPVSIAGAGTQPAPATTAEAATTDAATGGWSPVVSPFAGESLIDGTLARVAVTVVVTGSPQETFAFFEAMSAPGDQLFQVHEVTQEARQGDASSITGVEDAEDGDVITTITGDLFVLDAEVFPVDEGELETVSPNGEGFIEIDGGDTQPNG